MDNVVPVNESQIMFEFNCRKDKQKIIINALWNYSKLDMMQLATLLNISLKELQDTHSGKAYLCNETAKNLAHLFLILFGE